MLNVGVEFSLSLFFMVNMAVGKLAAVFFLILTDFIVRFLLKFLFLMMIMVVTMSPAVTMSNVCLGLFASKLKQPSRDDSVDCQYDQVADKNQDVI